MKKLVTAIAFGLLATSAFADLDLDGERAVWGVKELKQAQEASLVSFAEKFKEELGADALKYVVGFSIERNIQGTAGNATVTYKKDEKKTVKFFCHVHEADEIDCH